MTKKISLIEDLIDLFPTSPLKILLDNKNEQKNICVLSETLDFEYSNELSKEEQNILYSSEIKVYIEVDEKNADFNKIYSILNDFYCSVYKLEGSKYKDKYIFEVLKTGLYGYLGRDKQGNYCFSLNLKVKYYI